MNEVRVLSTDEEVQVNGGYRFAIAGRTAVFVARLLIMRFIRKYF